MEQLDGAPEWAFQLAEKIVLGAQGVGNAAVLIDHALARRIEAESAKALDNGA